MPVLLTFFIHTLAAVLGMTYVARIISDFIQYGSLYIPDLAANRVDPLGHVLIFFITFYLIWNAVRFFINVFFADDRRNEIY